jgi:hypothetical protein
MDDKQKKRLYEAPLSELHTMAKNTGKVASDTFVNNIAAPVVNSLKDLNTSATLPSATEAFMKSVEDVRNTK